MRKSVLVEEIKINEEGIFSVKPYNDSFAMIYRSAMGVHWHNNEYLYFVCPIREESDILRAYNQIALAVKEEYGKILKINQDTKYENISERLKKEIFKLCLRSEDDF